jgi:hypothetical protein
MPLKKHKELPIKVFADRMAYDCIHNAHSNNIGVSTNGYLPIGNDVPQTIGGRQSDVSNLTDPPSVVLTLPAPASLLDGHVFKDNPELEAPDKEGKTRPKRRRCPACTEENKKKAAGAKKKTPLTHKMCFHPACQERRYWVSGKWVYGVFYCPEHFQCHFAAVLQGNGNV